MAVTALSLVVLRTHQRDAMLQFYRTLGLYFKEERHGSGPVHFAAKVGSQVVEIYPGIEQPRSDYRYGRTTQIGFQVDDIEAVLAALQAGGVLPVTPPQRTIWGHRAVVLDPDGRAVEILQPSMRPRADANRVEGENQP